MLTKALLYESTLICIQFSPKELKVFIRLSVINFHSMSVRENHPCSLLSSTFLDNILLRNSVELKKATVSI